MTMNSYCILFWRLALYWVVVACCIVALLNCFIVALVLYIDFHECCNIYCFIICNIALSLTQNWVWITVGEMAFIIQLSITVTVVRNWASFPGRPECLLWEMDKSCLKPEGWKYTGHLNIDPIQSHFPCCSLLMKWWWRLYICHLIYCTQHNFIFNLS